VVFFSQRSAGSHKEGDKIVGDQYVNTNQAKAIGHLFPVCLLLCILKNKRYKP
jgi:hypothetical protein